MISYIPYAIFLALTHHMRMSSTNPTSFGFNFRVSFMSWRKTEKTTKIYLCVISGPQGVKDNIHMINRGGTTNQGRQNKEIDLTKLESRSFFFESQELDNSALNDLYVKSWGRDASNISENVTRAMSLKDIKENSNKGPGKLQDSLHHGLTTNHFSLGDLCGFSDENYNFEVYLGIKEKSEGVQNIHYVYGLLSKGDNYQSYFGDYKEKQIKTMSKFTVALGKELDKLELPDDHPKKRKGDNNNGKTKELVIVGVGILAAVIILSICFFIVLRTTKKNKAKKSLWKKISRRSK